jgi:hypothetical protein
MNATRRAALGGLVLALAGVGALADPAPAPTAAKVIRYTDLGKVVRGYRGKVVVVDFWADY